MTSRYRTAFAAPSGFTTTTAAPPRAAAPAPVRSERKPAILPGAAGRQAREQKAETLGKSAAA